MVCFVCFELNAMGITDRPCFIQARPLYRDIAARILEGSTAAHERRSLWYLQQYEIN